MKRLILVCLLLLFLCGCREEGIIIETMTPSPPTSVTETKEGQSLRVVQKRKLLFLMSCLFLLVLFTLRCFKRTSFYELI